MDDKEVEMVLSKEDGLFSQLFGLSESRPIIEKLNKLKSLVFKNISSVSTHKK